MESRERLKFLPVRSSILMQQLLEDEDSPQSARKPKTALTKFEENSENHDTNIDDNNTSNDLYSFSFPNTRMKTANSNVMETRERFKFQPVRSDVLLKQLLEEEESPESARTLRTSLMRYQNNSANHDTNTDDNISSDDLNYFHNTRMKTANLIENDSHDSQCLPVLLEENENFLEFSSKEKTHPLSNDDTYSNEIDSISDILNKSLIEDDLPLNNNDLVPGLSWLDNAPNSKYSKNISKPVFSKKNSFNKFPVWDQSSVKKEVGSLSLERSNEIQLQTPVNNRTTNISSSNCKITPSSLSTLSSKKRGISSVDNRILSKRNLRLEIMTPKFESKLPLKSITPIQSSLLSKHRNNLLTIKEGKIDNVPERSDIITKERNMYMAETEKENFHESHIHKQNRIPSKKSYDVIPETKRLFKQLNFNEQKHPANNESTVVEIKHPPSNNIPQDILLSNLKQSDNEIKLNIFSTNQMEINTFEQEEKLNTLERKPLHSNELKQSIKKDEHLANEIKQNVNDKQLKVIEVKQQSSSEFKQSINKLQEPSIKLKQPGNELKQLSNGFNQPSNEFMRLGNELEQPISELKQPSKEFKQPGNELKHPTNGLNQPSNEFRLPSNEVKQPINEFKQPSNELKQICIELKPSNGLNQPSNEFRRPSNELQQPIRELKQPSNGVKQPSNELKQSSNELKHRSNELQQPISELKQPSKELKYTNNEMKQPNNELKQPNNELNPNDELKLRSNECKQPSNELQQPINELKQPSNELQQPSNELKQPNNELKQPNNELKRPSNEFKQPSNEFKQPSIKENNQQSNKLSANEVKQKQYNKDEKQLLDNKQLNVGGTVPINLLGHTFQQVKVGGKYYIITNKIGEGGSGQVYKCLEQETLQERAIKVVNLNVDAATVKSCIDEVKMLKELQGNNKVIKMFDYEQINQYLFVVMEKGDIDFSSFLKSYAKESEVEISLIIYYWIEMLKCVLEIHKKGIIHSDLKPSNFVIVVGRLKLIDFGIASRLTADMTSVIKNVTVGTFNFISPEALLDSRDCANDGAPQLRISYKSDVWSLGCILYQMIYKRTPFQNVGNIWAKFAAITDRNHKISYPEIPRVPSFLVQMLKQCLIYDMRSRPSVQELLDMYYSNGMIFENI